MNTAESIFGQAKQRTTLENTAEADALLASDNNPHAEFDRSGL